MTPRLALLLALSLAGRAAAAETVLVIGDSHTAGAFGEGLDAALRAKPGNRVATYGVCSARPQSYLTEDAHGCGHLFRGFDGKPPSKWLGARVFTQKQPDGKGGVKDVEMVKTPELAQLLADHSPTAVIVALGTNMPISGASVRKTLALIHKAGAACFWVGPPSTRKPGIAAIGTVYETLDANSVWDWASLDDARKDACRLVDSRFFTYLRYPAKEGDGTHYGGTLAPLGMRWGADSAKAVLSVLTP